MDFNCSICQNTLIVNYDFISYAPNCYHLFHKSCILKTDNLLTNSVICCPICKSDDYDETLDLLNSLNSLIDNQIDDFIDNINEIYEIDNKDMNNKNKQ
jgi:hypothetical protein